MSTRLIPRQVNPIWNAQVMVQGLQKFDRLQFMIKDVGLLQESHALGFGPRVVASRSVPVDQGDYNGWLELDPSDDIQHNGQPLLAVEIKFVRERNDWPTPGIVDHRISVLESQATQGLQLAPSAPAKVIDGSMSMSDTMLDTGAELEPERRFDEVTCGGATPLCVQAMQPGVAASTASTALAATPVVVAATESPGVAASSMQPWQGSLRWQTFHIDPRVYSIAKRGQLLDILKLMSDRTACPNFELALVGREGE